MLRSVLSVIAGYVVIAVLTIITFLVLGFVVPGTFSQAEANTVLSTPWLLVIIGFGFVYAIIGGCTTTFLAKRAIFQHVLALAGILLVLGVVELVMGSGSGRPLWYRVTLLIAGVVGVLLGGGLRARQVANRIG